MPLHQSKRLLPGDQVEVRSWPEIAATLDANGRLEGLPFMPEMLRWCGTRGRVYKCLERTCEETEGGMRRIRKVVFLDGLRCDGTEHGRCQKECMLFWKEAWVKRVDPSAPEEDPALARPAPGPVLPTRSPDGRYVCQSTELIRATMPFAGLELASYWRDLSARTYTPWRLSSILAKALFLRLRRLALGRSYRVLQGDLRTTPIEMLGLQPGEMVRVKSQQHIASTLDFAGKNQGLAFTIEMLPYCGKTLRVHKRLERMIVESTCKVIEVKNTVILRGVTCDGCHIMRGGCPRENYHFWREAWLERVNEERVNEEKAAGVEPAEHDPSSVAPDVGSPKGCTS
jgi:hypothetical protein